MHFFNVVLILAFLTGITLAQSTQLVYPPSGSTLTAGSEITVQLISQSYPEEVVYVALLIGLEQCPGGQCSPPSSFMGNLLYQGAYNPTPDMFSENFTVQIPSDFANGPASLNVLNLYLVGESNVPTVQYASENVNVVVAAAT